MTFKDYLHKRYSPKTALIYIHDVKAFVTWMGYRQAQKATWSDIMDYIAHLRSMGSKNPLTINRSLYGVKAWYTWLVRSGVRDDHPCRYIKLKDIRQSPLQFQDLFTLAELKQLLDRKERFPSMQLRNQVIMSLLVYQALTAGEIVHLTLADIDLEKAQLKIRPSRKLNGRTLDLEADQVMLFYRYIHESRPKLLGYRKTDQFVLTLRGTPENGEGIHYLVSTFRKVLPGKKLTPYTIRASVIANLLQQGKPLREVQYLAGHKKISSTEKYKQTSHEKLKMEVSKYHPLG